MRLKDLLEIYIGILERDYFKPDPTHTTYTFGNNDFGISNSVRSS